MASRKALLTTILTLATTAVAAVSAPTAASAAITCETATSGGSTWYPGPSASYLYDDLFWPGPTIPATSTHIPQGAATWRDWDGSGQDLFLVGAYRSGDDSYIHAIDTATWTVLASVPIAEMHASGLAVVGGWLLVSEYEELGGTVWRYRLSDLRTKINQGGFLSDSGTQPITTGGFMGQDGSYVYIGQFNPTGRGRMYQYTVNSLSGQLNPTGNNWEAPTKSQGLIATSTHFIFSTSYGRNNRSNIYVVRRGYTGSLDDADLFCFRAPSMTEGMTLRNGYAYVVYESAAPPYGTDPSTLNKINKMHYAQLSDLTSLA